MTFYCRHRADCEAVLAVEAESLIVWADNRETIRIGAQDMDNTVLDAGLAFQAFLFIYTNH